MAFKDHYSDSWIQVIFLNEISIFCSEGNFLMLFEGKFFFLNTSRFVELILLFIVEKILIGVCFPTLDRLLVSFLITISTSVIKLS